jgi:hypothetical protein
MILRQWLPRRDLVDDGSALGEHRAVQWPAIGQEQNTRLSWERERE